MKIWLIKDSEMLPIDSGNQRIARMGLIAQELEQQGHEVIWWTSTFSHFTKTFRQNVDHKEKVSKNYFIFLLKTFGYKKNVSLKRLAHNWKIASSFYKLAMNEEKPDIVVVALPTISFVIKSIKYGKKMNIPVIVDVRDLNPDVFVDAFSGIKKIVVKVGIIPLKIALANAMKNATAIFGTTQPYLDFGLTYANRRQREADRVYYVAYPEVKKVNDKLIRKYSGYFSNNKIIISFFGQFGRMVDIGTVIEAAKICKENNINAMFLLCGTGEKLKDYKKESVDLDNIIFLGWVNSDEIRVLGGISVAGLLAYYPSKNYELQMPNKFGEYLSMGMIPLVQPDGIMKDIVRKERCGYYYKTAEDLANIISRIDENKDDIEKMKKNARLLYERRFNANVVYKDYANHVVEIAEDYKNEI